MLFTSSLGFFVLEFSVLKWLKLSPIRLFLLKKQDKRFQFFTGHGKFKNKSETLFKALVDIFGFCYFWY